MGRAQKRDADHSCCPIFRPQLHKSHPPPCPQRGACMAQSGVEDEADHGVCTEGLHHIRQQPWLAVMDNSE